MRPQERIALSRQRVKALVAAGRTLSQPARLHELANRSHNPLRHEATERWVRERAQRKLGRLVHAGGPTVGGAGKRGETAGGQRATSGM